MKLIGNTKRKITEDKNGENISYLEILEEILVQCSVAINDFQQEMKVL